MEAAGKGGQQQQQQQQHMPPAYSPGMSPQHDAAYKHALTACQMDPIQAKVFAADPSLGFTATVPPGYEAGHLMQVRTPSGHLLPVKVPDGKGPGDAVHVRGAASICASCCWLVGWLAGWLTLVAMLARCMRDVWCHGCMAAGRRPARFFGAPFSSAAMRFFGAPFSSAARILRSSSSNGPRARSWRPGGFTTATRLWPCCCRPHTAVSF
jgi:hypothetical protein